MRIAINCRSILKSQRTGIGRYTYSLIQFLARIDEVNQYDLYAARGIFDAKRQDPITPNSRFKVRRDFFNLGARRMLRGAQVYHLPSPDFVDGPAQAKVIVTVHDLIHRAFARGHTPQTIELTEKKMQDVIRRADILVCVSQATRDDLIRFYDVPAEKCRVIYQGVDHEIFFPIDEKNRGQSNELLGVMGITGPFVLFVGTLEPRKNLSGLIKAFAKVVKDGYDGFLVVAGMKGWMTNDLEDQLKTFGLNNKVILTGFVTDEQLRLLYATADTFVFPSFYEGFGFPIVEALACGALVISSQSSSCGEIAKDAALLVNPQDEDDLAKKLSDVLRNPRRYDFLRSKAVARAREFSFEATARQTLALYNQVAGRVG